MSADVKGAAVALGEIRDSVDTPLAYVTRHGNTEDSRDTWEEMNVSTMGSSKTGNGCRNLNNGGGYGPTDRRGRP
jgi:hypothetical protein